jgi:hypothetical protein
VSLRDGLSILVPFIFFAEKESFDSRVTSLHNSTLSRGKFWVLEINCSLFIGKVSLRDGLTILVLFIFFADKESLDSRVTNLHNSTSPR